jgi:hypothetical protein
MLKIVVDGWPLLPVVMGLVELVKKVFPRLAGNWIVLVSFVIGGLLGSGYMISYAKPVTFSEWFIFGVGCLIYGLIPCGLYDVATKNQSLPKIWK